MKAVEELICRNSTAIAETTQPEDTVDIDYMCSNLLLAYRGREI